MPKIIENPEKRLMEEARGQVTSIGCGTLTSRSFEEINRLIGKRF